MLIPSAAAAENCTAPPGTSGLDQYCEALPAPGGSGGSHHHGGGGGGGGSSNHDSIPPSTVKQLQRSGSAGAAVLALSGSSPVAAGGQKSGSSSGSAGSGRHKRHHAPAQRGGASKPAPVDTGSHTSAPASNPASAVGKSVSGSLGAGFIGLLAGIAVLLGALAWVGRRHRPGAEGA